MEGRDATHYPLALIVQPGEALQLRLDYRGDLFDRGTVEAIGQRLVRLLTAAVADATRPLGSLAILDEAERSTILEGFNATARDLAPATLPSLFAAQAARTPDAVAVVFEDRALTYAALDAHANRLANHLRGLGVGPETVVGLCVERSPEMVVGLLGILKAGARLSAARSELSARAAGLHAVGRRRPGAGDAAGAARRGCRLLRDAAPHPARRSFGWTPTGR